MTRARCVLGSPDMQQRFETMRRSVITTVRDHQGLRGEISTMRAKMRQGLSLPPERFDLKHSPGGMVDIEFAVQFLVLAHSAQHPSLLDNRGNIALLVHAQACGLLPAPVGDNAAQAYRQFRHLQHQARLDEEPAQLPLEQVAQARAAGLALWALLLGEPVPAG